MLKIYNEVWQEHLGYWQIRVTRSNLLSGKWVSYNNVVWC